MRPPALPLPALGICAYRFLLRLLFEGQLWRRLYSYRASRSALGYFRVLSFLRALDALDHERAPLVRVAPANDLDPLVGLEILVMCEEMLDLLDRDRGQVRIAIHVRIALGELCRRHGEQLLVIACLVFHDQDADDLATHDGARNDCARVRDDHVAGIAVARERMGDEPVIPREPHGGIEEPVDLERATFLVH